MTHGAGLRATWTPATIGALAAHCLDLELDTWPKPGLVSPVDSGSHPDMDADLLRRSAAVLAPFFATLAAAGRTDFEALRSIGLRAEAAMLAETRGVNTHRGAIFGLGLLCAAAGQPIARDHGETLGDLVRSLWGNTLTAALPVADSHGAHVARTHKVLGARGEAAGGFPSVYGIGLPALAAGRRLSPQPEAARVHAFFALLAAVDDTNLLHRGGADGLAFAQGAARAFLARGGVGAGGWREDAAALHAAFVARRLSPGGCADLLAMTLFVDAVEDEP